MEDQTCRHKSSSPSREKSKEQCEKLLSRLSRMRCILDKSLDDFIDEELRKIVEQLRDIIKTMHSLPDETLHEHIYSSDILLQSLQSTVIELQLALDQCSLVGNKAILYRHLLLAQGYFTEALAHGLSEPIASTNAAPPLAPVISIFLHRMDYQRSVSLSLKKMLLHNQSLFHRLDRIWPGQCEQAIADMRGLVEFLERQKAVLNKSPIPFHENRDTVSDYRLKIAFSYASELTDKLVSLLSTFQGRCHSISRQTMLIKEEIVYYLTLLIHHYEDLLQAIDEAIMRQDQTHSLQSGREEEQDDILSLRS